MARPEPNICSQKCGKGGGGVGIDGDGLGCWLLRVRQAAA